MKTGKKILVIFFALAVVIGLASCSKKTNETQVASAPAPVPAPAVAAQVQTAPVVKVEAPAPAPAPVVQKELTMEEKLVADQWCFKYTAEGYGDYAFFFRFYDADPVLGKVYYAGFTNNKMNFAGKYALVEQEYPYSIFNNREDALAKTNEVVGKVPFTVVLYDWDDKEKGRIGFDGEKIYNAQDKNTAKIYATGSTPYAYVKNEGSYDEVVKGEMPVAVLEFVADDEVTSTLKINHNHTYTDLVGAMIEGTWTAQEKNGEITFNFKPNDATDSPAVVVVSADKQTATYTAGNEAAVKMSVPKPAATVAYVFEGTTATSYGKEATLTLTAMNDGTFTIVGTIFGNSMEFDKGTYTVVGGYKFAFECEKAGHIDSIIVDRAVHIAYKQSGTKLGDLESDMVAKK